VNRADGNDAQRCAAMMIEQGCEAPEILEGFDAETFFGALAGLDAFVGERLHSVVLASLTGVPVAMLDYQPKCADFMSSLDLTDCSLRTDQMATAEVVDLVERLHRDGPMLRVRIDAGVAKLRGALLEEVARLRSTGILVGKPVD
jgi:polysaccharide pyruvyl transferase WcaK-like protein